MKKVLIFAERMLPFTQTFIPIQAASLTQFSPQYIGLIPAVPSFPLSQRPILLTHDRGFRSRSRRELYRWTGVAPQFHSLARDSKAVLLHAHFAEGATAAVSISTAMQIPVIVHLRGGAEMQQDEVLRQKLFQLPYLLWRRRLWERASLFLCVSDFIRRKALATGFPGHKLRVHYTGIDCSNFSPSKYPERDPHLVLYVGRLVEYKGGADLVRAMHIVRKTQPKAHVAFVGDGVFRSAVEALARELNVPCVFVGEQSSGVVRSWLERARVFCAPSKTLPDGMSEAFGNVFTESQAMGVPVVSYRHGGIAETIVDGKTGLLAAESDYIELAAHISRYLEDDAFWIASRETGMRWVRENFDVRLQTQKLERIYEEVLSNQEQSAAAQAPPHP
jgi:colanic acid/amylovoran biosynthesis glycosyltransferase